MQIIIPCAGFGQRFRDQGHACSKPLIRVAGRRMLDWALDCVPVDATLHLIARRDQTDILDSHSLSESLPLGAPRLTRLHLIEGPTQGAALTVLSVAVGLDPERPVWVMNCDQWVDADLMALERDALAAGLAGLILTFPGHGPQWSYALVDRHDFVTRVLEKIEAPESHATCGIYFWSRAESLVHSICRMVAAGERTRGEYYLAPAANFLVDKLVNLVKAVPADKFMGMGTPEQVRSFELAVLRGDVQAPARVC